MSDTRPPIVITGGAGFIGSHLAERLSARGHRLTLVDDFSTGSADNVAHLLGENVRLVEGRASTALSSGAVDLAGARVFHLAASVGVQLVVDSPAAMMHNNLGETAAVLSACSAHGCRVLVASSSEVYGLCPEVPLHETTPLVFGPTTASRWSYGLAKALDEHLALDLGRAGRLEPVVVRLFNTIGPRQIGRYGMVVPRFVAAAAAEQPLQIFGDGRQTRTFCDVRDVVAALDGLMNADAAVGEVFNVGGGDEITIEQLADRVLAAWAARSGEGGGGGGGSGGRKAFVSYDDIYGPGFEDPPQRRPSTDKLRALLGWSPQIPLDQTLRELFEASSGADVKPEAVPAEEGG